MKKKLKDWWNENGDHVLTGVAVIITALPIILGAAVLCKAPLDVPEPVSKPYSYRWTDANRWE